MADKIDTLHPKNDLDTNLYPNIKSDNIPDKAITPEKLQYSYYVAAEVDSLLAEKASASDLTSLDARESNLEGIVSTISTQVAGKQDKLTFDTTPTESSTNPVTSGGVYQSLSTKQNALNFDASPTENSSNPVTSGGVYTSLGGKQDALTSSSVASGTIAKAIGFDSSNNLVQGEVSGGGSSEKGFTVIWDGGGSIVFYKADGTTELSGSASGKTVSNVTGIRISLDGSGELEMSGYWYNGTKIIGSDYDGETDNYYEDMTIGEYYFTLLSDIWFDVVLAPGA